MSDLNTLWGDLFSRKFHMDLEIVLALGGIYLLVSILISFYRKSFLDFLKMFLMGIPVVLGLLSGSIGKMALGILMVNLLINLLPLSAPYYDKKEAIKELYMIFELYRSKIEQHFKNIDQEYYKPLSLITEESELSKAFNKSFQVLKGDHTEEEITKYMYELFLYVEENRQEIESYYRDIDQGILTSLTQGRVVYPEFTNAFTFLGEKVAIKENRMSSDNFNILKAKNI